VAESHEASHDPLHPLYIMNRTHSSDGRNLLWIGFDATLRDDEPEQHTSQDPKNALFGVEFYAILLELLEGFFEVSHDLVNLFGLDYDVIHVGLDDLSDEITKTLEHTSLVRYSRVF
jgi:hypothetical protein